MHEASIRILPEGLPPSYTLEPHAPFPETSSLLSRGSGSGSSRGRASGPSASLQTDHKPSAARGTLPSLGFGAKLGFDPNPRLGRPPVQCDSTSTC